MDNCSTVLTRPGADVHYMVRRPDRLLVMLDHDHGVAEIPQSDQRLDESLVVSLVEADGRLIKDIQHTY